jgi:phosphoglycerate dehydrogenase-like enzyme/predicted dehydrogenase
MHLPALARLQAAGEVELALVCDLQRARASAARRRFGFREESGEAGAALARSDIDAVYVFGSAQLHHQYGLAALDAGKHLFVEKPVAPTYREAKELAELARARSLIAVGGHNRRFYRAFDRIRADAGKAGWRYVEAVSHKPETGKPVPFGAHSWLGANGIHALDALVYMMGGLPTQLTAQCGEAGATRPAAFSAVMRWADGAQGIFQSNNEAGVRREEYSFHAAGQTWRVTDDELIVEREGRAVRHALKSLGDGIDAEHASFLRAIRTQEEPRHSLAKLAPSLLLVELIESGFSGQVPPPQAHPAGARASGAPSHTILVAGELPAIAPLLAGHSLVSLDDLHASTAVRADVRAAILGHGAAPLTAETLGKLPKLEIVGVVGLSVARFDAETLLARGVALVNASGSYADGVAEFALGLAILGRRRAFVSHELMRAGAWGTRADAGGWRNFAAGLARKTRPLLAAAALEPLARRLWRASAVPGNSVAGREPRELRGAVAGLIGWSENARCFAALLIHCGVRVNVWSEHAAEGEIEAAGATRASLAEVLGADIVSLHRGLNAGTRHFLGAAELARLRPGAVLINIARGALIEPAALYERLQRGDLIACLDTFDAEPLAPGHPLRVLPNVFLTSHIAGGSRGMREAAAREVTRKTLAHLSGDGGGTITPERLRTMS